MLGGMGMERGARRTYLRQSFDSTFQRFEHAHVDEELGSEEHKEGHAVQPRDAIEDHGEVGD